jgi:calcium/calmodulin-dependent protein kinase I
VYKGTEKSNNEEWAIKVIKKKFIKRQLLEREIDIMTKVRTAPSLLVPRPDPPPAPTPARKTTHPCILYCKEVYETDDTIFLVLELVRGGELYDFVVDHGEYTEAEAKVIVLQLVSAVEYLHEQGIAHRE